jgi:hypothetical protein
MVLERSESESQHRARWFREHIRSSSEVYRELESSLDGDGEELECFRSVKQEAAKGASTREGVVDSRRRVGKKWGTTCERHPCQTRRS